MKSIVVFAGLMLAAPVAAQTGTTPVDLHLICEGVGDHQVAHGAFGTGWGRRGSVSAYGVSTSSEQFGEQMDVEMVGGVARTRVPRRFLPPAHGGDGGWFDIKELTVGPDEITGTVLINFANHPKLRIDRRSGAIEMDGKVGAYSGQCKPYDPANAQHAF